MANATTPVIQINEGKVGIGVIDPAAKLHIKSSGNATLIKAYSQGYKAMDLWGATNGSQLTLHGGAEAATIVLDGRPGYNSYFTTGNVGIGVTLPGAKLDVDGVIRAGSGGSTSGSLGFEIDYSGANVINTWSTEYSSSDSVFGVAVRAKDGVANAFTSTAGNAAFQKGALVLGDDLEFLNAPGTTVAIGGDVAMTSRFKINSLGNVSIGTTTFPTTAIGDKHLLVQGAIISKPPGVDDYYSYLKSNWAADGAFELGIQGADVNHKLITTSGYYHGTHLNFWTSDQKRMVIDTNGNVGIGVTGPIAKLQVEGKVYVQGSGQNWNETTPGTTRGSVHFDPGTSVDNTGNALTFGASDASSGTTSQAGIYTRSDGNYGTKMYFATTDSYASGSKTAMMIDYNANVGIGDTTPSYKLDVNGTIRATGDIIAYSDARVKENIKTIDNALNKIDKLRGVEFNKIGEDIKSIGVIAQEIEKVIPEVVREDDKGMKSVAYGNISGLLIEAIKELKAEIDLLKSKPCTCNKCNCNI